MTEQFWIISLYNSHWTKKKNSAKFQRLVCSSFRTERQGNSALVFSGNFFLSRFASWAAAEGLQSDAFLKGIDVSIAFTKFPLSIAHTPETPVDIVQPNPQSSDIGVDFSWHKYWEINL